MRAAASPRKTGGRAMAGLPVTTKAVAEKPSAGDYVSRGDAWISKGEYDKAIAEYSEAVRSRRREIPQHISVATPTATRTISIAKSPTIPRPFGSIPSTRTHTTIAAVPGTERAISIARSPTTPKAIRINPKDTDAYCGRANARCGKGDYERAIADYNKAIRLDPKCGKAFAARGGVYASQGDAAYAKEGMSVVQKTYAKAIADYTEAVRLGRKDGDLWYNRALTYVKTGDTDRAIADFTEAIRPRINGDLPYIGRGFACTQCKAILIRPLPTLHVRFNLIPNRTWPTPIVAIVTCKKAMQQKPSTIST